MLTPRGAPMCSPRPQHPPPRGTTLLHMHTRTCMCGALFDLRAALPGAKMFEWSQP